MQLGCIIPEDSTWPVGACSPAGCMLYSGPLSAGASASRASCTPQPGAAHLHLWRGVCARPLAAQLRQLLRLQLAKSVAADTHQLYEVCAKRHTHRCCIIQMTSDQSMTSILIFVHSLIGAMSWILQTAAGKVDIS